MAHLSAEGIYDMIRHDEEITLGTYYLCGYAGQDRRAASALVATPSCGERK